MRRRFAGHWTNPARLPPFFTLKNKSRQIGIFLMPCAISHRAMATKNAEMSAFNFNVVIPVGVEPTIFWMRTRRPGPLDDGTTCIQF